MFRIFTVDENSSGGQQLPAHTGQGLPSAGLVSQESSWMSFLSRPPLSILQKYVTGRPRIPALCDEWFSSMKTSFLCEENVFLRQMDDMIPFAHTASNSSQLQGLVNGAAANTWLLQGTKEAEAEVSQKQRTPRSSSRTFISRVWSTCPEMNPGGGARRWSSFWGGSGVSAQALLSGVSHVHDHNLTGPHCKTKAPAVFIQSRWILGENAGPTSYKGETFNAGALQRVRNIEGAAANHHWSGPGRGPAPLDQDNGYSSLEEELFQVSCLHMLTETSLSPCETGDPTVESNLEQEDTSEDADLLRGEEDEDSTLDTAAEVERDSLTLPKCQNKAIAFIMGCPCSDDDDEEEEDEDDDDGFDSEGSSSLCESSGDDEHSDSEVGGDPEHLWSSVCPSRDPYNPQNFMAQLQSRSRPQTSPVATTPQSDPSLLPCTPSPPASQPPSDSWDDSASDSDSDEAESLRLWSSFSSCWDPYSPLNFQATLRTRGPGQAGARTRTGEASSPRTSPSEKGEPAESLDSSFGEAGQSTRTIKKVSERP